MRECIIHSTFKNQSFFYSNKKTWQPLGPLLKVKLVVGPTCKIQRNNSKGRITGIRRSPDRCAKKKDAPKIQISNLMDGQCNPLNMVKSRYIGDGRPPTFNRNPYNGYINPYYWVDDHPLLYGNNGSLDPGTYGEFYFLCLKMACYRQPGI